MVVAGMYKMLKKPKVAKRAVKAGEMIGSMGKRSRASKYGSLAVKAGKALRNKYGI